MAANFTNENFHRLLVHLKQMGDATNFHSEMSEEYKQFISLFPLASLPTLTLDQYCIGKGDSSSFCWWIERGLQPVLARYMPGTSKGHLLYFLPDGTVYQNKKLADLSDEDALAYTLKIQHCIAAADPDEDMSWVDDDNQIYQRAGVEPRVTVSNGRKLRLLTCYQPTKLLPISSPNHLGHFLNVLGWPQDDIPGESQPIARMQRLISYYHLARQSLPALTPYGFMLGLYAEALGLAPMKEAQSDKDEDDACEQHETLIDQHNNQACSPCNQIFYGPPGTGKTYTLQALQKQYTSTPAHSDKLLWLQEKIAPLNWMQVLVLSLLDLGKQAKVADIVNSQYFQTKAKINKREGNLSQTAWSYLQKFTVPESETVNYKGRSEPAVFDKTADSVWILLDDKLELVDDLVQLYAELERGPQSGMQVKRYSTVTFHQSYGYEEFIEGLKAATDDEGNVHYSLEAGAFLTLCRRAEQDPEHQYAIFIDEINRGNIAKIFGELISLIEIDKRAQGKYPMAINLAYSKQSFSVPSNVDIIGTMNTADRSLALMDTALRRRFEFIEMMPDPALFAEYSITCSNGVTINLQQLLATLNARIAALYDREHTLGHAFFFPAYHAVQSGDHVQGFQALKAAFQTKILPLLQEYFYDDWSKIRLVLGDNQKPEALQFIHQQSVDYPALFGRHYQADDVTSEQQYVLMDNTAAVWNEALAYLAIYAAPEAKQHSQQPSPDNLSQTDTEQSEPASV
ncbi:AAA family ATPase [Edwardsiella ictaluri]|uniref:McrB family protein n=1 Tax=Edwardsiella ictaluri TaxID=67780 RepID=UPI001E3BFE57|nr:AAA family ATPase [Edwardsiella ictaluri]UYB62542.1 AAA family ATPase [Edwardsiella ictaluri]UYB65766.1 AAA family ATPase [Edwardsiella ictaluri]